MNKYSSLLSEERRRTSTCPMRETDVVRINKKYPIVWIKAVIG